MENFQDRRQYKRVEGFFEVFVNFNPETPAKFYCISQDISEGGMRIRTPRPLKDRNQAILTFNLPNSPKEITMQVVVAWASSVPKDDGYFESGIKFLEIDDNDLDTIRSYVSEHSDKVL